MNRKSPSKVASAINDGWLGADSFFGSILAGTLLGFFADRWLGTGPWLVVIGVIVGSYAGFAGVWKYIKEMDDTPGPPH